MELPCFAQYFPKNIIGYAARCFDNALAGTRFTGFAKHMCQGFPGSLACHFNQTQLRKTSSHGFDAVTLQLFFELCEYFFFVVFAPHVNKVSNDDATQIAQSKLPCNGLCGFQIGFKNGVIKVACANISTGIDIHGGEGLGLVNNQIAARFQINAAPQGLGDFFINSVKIKNRALTFVMLKFLGCHGHEFSTKVMQKLKLFSRINANGLGPLTHQIPQNTLQQIEILVQHALRRLCY